MLDKTLLFRGMLISAILGTLLKLGGHDGLSMAFVFMCALNSVLYAATRTTQIEILEAKSFQIRDPNANILRNQMMEAIEGNPELRAAVTYAYNLTPEDFIKFGRIVVELRANADQSWLRELSHQFRKEKKQ